jgi:hypothetical protein
MAEPSIKDLAYRTAASVFGGPVDLATMVMRPFGYNTPDTQVMGGSEWIGKKMEEAGLVSSARAPLTEFIASVAVPSPGGLAKGAALAAPAIGGMIAKGNGVMSKSIEDALMVAEEIKKLGPQYLPKIQEAAGGSVYLTVSTLPLTQKGVPAKNRNPTPIDFKARFADHPSYWGSTISSDPITNNTPETVVSMFKNKIGMEDLPPYSTARFNPADKYGSVTDVYQKDGLSLKGNPVIKTVKETRPFTFYEPKWNADAAQKAKILQDIGVDKVTIWKETGTWQGPDGKWRQQQPVVNQPTIE